jgi:serine/threonine-protein kinase
MITLPGTNGTYAFDPQDASSRLGQGGMGVVFRGEALETGQPVAVKVLYRELTAQASHVERARREAAIQMKHENLLEMLDFVEVNGIYHSVSEFLEGETLARRLDARRERGEFLAFEEVKRIGEALLNALEALHTHQPRLIHRDVDPSNVMLCADGRIKLMDFGVVKVSDGVRKSLTGLGAILGKPHYSAPEQIRNRPGDEVDESTDLYAVGITLYELFTGQVPFDAPNEYDLMQLQIQRPLPRHPRLSREVFAFLQKATSKDQRRRYRSAMAMRRALTALPEAPPRPPAPPLWKRRPVQLAAVTVPLLTLLGGLWYQQRAAKTARYLRLCVRADSLRNEARFDSAARAYGLALAVLDTDSIRSRKKGMESLPVAVARLDAKRYNEAYWRFAADTTDPTAREAFYFLGEMTRQGFGTRPDPAKALRLYERAAALGDGLARKRLGDARVDGWGGSLDYAGAAAWFERALASPQARGMALYGLYYVYSAGGYGVVRDYPRSLGYLREGARAGSRLARLQLGRKYRDGEAGIPRNLDSARYWLRLSADMGDANARSELAALNRFVPFDAFSLSSTPGLDRPRAPVKPRPKYRASFWDRLFGPSRPRSSKR